MLSTKMDDLYQEGRSEAFFDSVEGRPTAGRIRQPGSPQIQIKGLDEAEDALQPLTKVIGGGILGVLAKAVDNIVNKKLPQLIASQGSNIADGNRQVMAGSGFNLGELLNGGIVNLPESQRIHVFLENFRGVYGMDTDMVKEFFRHMDGHPDIMLDFSSTLTPRDIRGGAINQYLAAADEAVKEMFPDLTGEEARFLYWSYVWATNSGLTYAEGQSRLAFGRLGAGAIMGLATSVANKSFTTGIPAITRGGYPPNAPINPRTYIPQGISQVSFNRAVKLIREKTGHISDDIVVQGSRAGGTARPTSDIDFSVRVSPQKFDQLIKERFGTPNPGSQRESTKMTAIERGRIFARDAGLAPLRDELQRELGFGIEVDISIIKKGGLFDNSYFIIP